LSVFLVSAAATPETAASLTTSRLIFTPLDIPRQAVVDILVSFKFTSTGGLQDPLADGVVGDVLGISSVDEVNGGVPVRIFTTENIHSALGVPRTSLRVSEGLAPVADDTGIGAAERGMSDQSVLELGHVGVDAVSLGEVDDFDGHGDIPAVLFASGILADEGEHGGTRGDVVIKTGGTEFDGKSDGVAAVLGFFLEGSADDFHAGGRDGLELVLGGVDDNAEGAHAHGVLNTEHDVLRLAPSISVVVEPRAELDGSLGDVGGHVGSLLKKISDTESIFEALNTIGEGFSSFFHHTLVALGSKFLSEEFSEAISGNTH